MKNFRKDYIAIAITAIFAAFCVSVNIIALSSCSSFNPGSFGKIMNLSAPVEQMIRAYYGLSQDDFITLEMVNGITSLTVTINTTYENHILADFIVNGDEGYAKALPDFALSKYWNNSIQPAIDEAADKVNETSYVDLDGKVVDALFKKKIEAFYCEKDPCYPELTDRARQEMFLMYPDLKVKGKLFIFDPYSTEREKKVLYKCFDEAGLIDAWEVDSEAFDALQFAYFNNLKEIEFIGFTPVNYIFPSGVEVTVKDNNSDDEPISINDDGTVITSEETTI
jgi:hypothetical protein